MSGWFRTEIYQEQVQSMFSVRGSGLNFVSVIRSGYSPWSASGGLDLFCISYQEWVQSMFSNRSSGLYSVSVIRSGHTPYFASGTLDCINV